MNDTASPEVVQTVGVVEEIDVVPSPVVITTAVKPSLTAADAGVFVMLTVGVPCPTDTSCSAPSALAKFTPSPTCAVSLQVPTDTYVTANPDTVQTEVEPDEIDVVPSPVVVTVAVKPGPTAPLAGRFEIDTDGVP
jgi:hypothetical protein